MNGIASELYSSLWSNLYFLDVIWLSAWFKAKAVHRPGTIKDLFLPLEKEWMSICLRPQTLDIYLLKNSIDNMICLKIVSRIWIWGSKWIPNPFFSNSKTNWIVSTNKWKGLFWLVKEFCKTKFRILIRSYVVNRLLFWICVEIFLCFSFSEPSITDMEWKSGSSKMGQTLSSSIVSLLVIVSSTAVSSLLLSSATSWTTQCAYNKPLMLVKNPSEMITQKIKNSPVWLNYLLAYHVQCVKTHSYKV